MMRRYTLEIGGREFVVDVNELAIDSFEVMVGGDAYVVTLSGEEDLPDAAIAPQPERVALPGGSTGGSARGARRAHDAGLRAERAAPQQSRPAAAAARRSMRRCRASSSTIAVKAGDTVTRGQLVAVLDAMKMHNNIKSPRDGTIAEMCVAARPGGRPRRRDRALPRGLTRWTATRSTCCCKAWRT